MCDYLINTTNLIFFPTRVQKCAYFPFLFYFLIAFN